MHRMRSALKVVLIVGLVLATASVAYAQKVLLRYHYKPGEKYTSVTTSDQSIEQQIANQNVRIKQSMRMEMAMEVKSVDAAGVAEVDITYSRVALKQDSPMANIDYDSADALKKDVDHPALAGFKALVGKTLTVMLTRRGEVKSIKGLKEIAEEILNQVPAGPGREAARKQLAVMFDEKNYGERLGGLAIVLPQDPVGVGDAWNKDQKIAMGFTNMVVKTTYTVKSVGETVEIDVNSTIEPGGEPDPGLGMTTTIEKGTQKGLTKMQKDNAALMNGEIQQDLKMTINMRGRVIKQTLDAVTSFSTTRKQ